MLRQLKPDIHKIFSFNPKVINFQPMADVIIIITRNFFLQWGVGTMIIVRGYTKNIKLKGTTKYSSYLKMQKIKGSTCLKIEKKIF
jgi:hypothetical protein